MRKIIYLEEAISLLGLGRTKLYSLINTGELPAKKLGKRTVILKQDLDQYIENLDSYPVREQSSLGGKDA